MRDLPLCGHHCYLEIELAQVVTAEGKRRMEASDIVETGARFTQRFYHLVSGLCRHMSIKAVALHLGLCWQTVKNIDQAYLHKTLPDLDASALKNLKYIGVDEVASAKGDDYMTVIYDMEEGHLIGVEVGRTAAVFSKFLKALPEQTALNIKAVAMGMGQRIKNRSTKFCRMRALFLIVFMLCRTTAKPSLINVELNSEKQTMPVNS